MAINTKYYRTHPCIATSVAKDLCALLGQTPRETYLKESLMSKFCGPGTTDAETRRTRAFAKLLASETRNKRTNDRISNHLSHAFSRYGFDAYTILRDARQVISQLLGEFSYAVYLESSFSSGAAVGFTRRRGDSYYKYGDKITVTPNAIRRVIALVRCTPPWHRLLTERYGENPANWLVVVPGNECFTVPKESDIDRAAAKEPTGNMLLQTAIGTSMRSALLKAGINLRDQSRNRVAAYRASITGADATIDLSDASNSMTLALVEALLPDDWWRACIAARSPVGRVGPFSLQWNMMSSMGNGFTFELESLIFYAIAEAVRRRTGTPGRVLVYGDDIVVPTPCAHAVIAVLGFAGFRCNSRKTFVKGPFRESCGGHYLNGLDITPFYIRTPVTDTSRVIWLLNSIRKWAGDTGICDPRLEDLYFSLRRKYVHPSLWNGKRLSSITSLAGPGKPRMRLRLVSESRRINGMQAVLRTFQYAVGEDRRPRFEDDPFGMALTADEIYEMYGSVPISERMDQLLTVCDRVTIRDNTEQRAEEIPVFLREIPQHD